jgi:hypothetical protein
MSEGHAPRRPRKMSMDPPRNCSYSRWTSEIKYPFHAMIPSLLYEQDQDDGNFMRFREARAVRVQKDFMMQLCTTDFRSLARCMEQFVSRVRHRKTSKFRCRRKVGSACRRRVIEASSDLTIC